jgi:ketosteroid isomerase-like protein
MTAALAILRPVSDDPSDLLHRSIDAWNADDLDGLSAFWDPEGKIIGPSEWPESGVFEGWPAIRGQFERLKDAWAEEHIEIVASEAVGDKVLTEIRWVARGEASGVDLDQPMWMVTTVSDGLFRRIAYFMDAESARADAETAA